MSDITKIIWKEKPCPSVCGGTESTLTLTDGKVLFKRIARKVNLMDARCPFSYVNESWGINVASPHYKDSFKELSELAKTLMANKDNCESSLGAPLQTLAIYYDDGSQDKADRVGFIFVWGELREKLHRFLPDLMVESVFGCEEQEEVPVC